ncbi:hypothetical protein KJ951_02425, partial [Patescibacteria group bacterium]|nr:hypothetical protein [Patescibacteria group bacterium]
KYIIMVNTNNFSPMKTIVLKVDDKIPRELDIIESEEGLGNRTSTVTFLIKYYFLTKKSSLDQSIKILDRLLDKIDTEKLPSARQQLKNL